MLTQNTTGKLNLWELLQAKQLGLSNEEQRYLTVLNLGGPVAGLGHFGFLVVFWQLDYTVLAVYNVFSVLAFAFGTWRSFNGDYKTATYLCVLIEFPLHAVLATLYLGFEGGFWLAGFMSIAVLMLCPVFSRPVRFLLANVIVVIVGVVCIYSLETGATYDVPKWLSHIFLMNNFLTLALAISMVVAMYDVAVEAAEKAQRHEFQRAEGLLLNILPARIAARLKAQEEPLADSLTSVTVLFSDIAGFTKISRGMSAEALVTLLNDLFIRFDALVEQHGAEKIKTIGDGYMVATGLDGAGNHAERMINLAQDMHSTFEDFRQTQKLDIGLRTGVHSGAAVAGVIGKQKFAYDLWGDTVNVASRMESSGIADRIQMSSETYDLLPEHYLAESRGSIAIKGHAARKAYLLLTAE